MEVRLPDLPCRVPSAVACVASGQSRHGPRRLAVLVEVDHRSTDVSVSRRGRRGDLLRLDRLHCEPPRRRQRTAAPHPPQTEEHLDPTEPTTGGGHGARGIDDRCRTPRRRHRGGNGWWTILDPVEDLVEPEDLAAALDAEPTARLAWDGFPPSARKAMLWWVISAARQETRARRIDTIAAKAAEGVRARG